MTGIREQIQQNRTEQNKRESNKEKRDRQSEKKDLNDTEEREIDKGKESQLLAHL